MTLTNTKIYEMQSSRFGGFNGFEVEGGGRRRDQNPFYQAGSKPHKTHITKTQTNKKYTPIVHLIKPVREMSDDGMNPPASDPYYEKMPSDTSETPIFSRNCQLQKPWTPNVAMSAALDTFPESPIPLIKEYSLNHNMKNYII